MSGGSFSLFDMAIAGVPVLIFCVWQLVSINREIGKDKKPPPDLANDSSPESPGHPIGEHRLDDR